MAISNATTTSFSNLSALSNGATTATLRLQQHWSPSPLLAAAEHLVVGQGFTAATTASIAPYALSAVATQNENDTMTATALPAIEATSITLATKGVSVAITSEAIAQTADPGALLAIRESLVIQAMLDAVCYGASGSIAALSASWVAITTNSGGAASLGAFLEAAQQIRSVHGAHLKLIAIMSPRQANEVMQELRTTAQPVLNNPANGDLAARLVEGMPSETGFKFSYDGIDFYVANKKDQLYTSGGDVYGIVMVAPIGEDQGRNVAIQGPVVIAGRANPVAARSSNVEPVMELKPDGIAIYKVNHSGSNKENAAEDQYVYAVGVAQTHSTAASLPARVVKSLAD